MLAFAMMAVIRHRANISAPPKTKPRTAMPRHPWRRADQAQAQRAHIERKLQL
jgi:SRSO17 transposase